MADDQSFTREETEFSSNGTRCATTVFRPAEPASGATAGKTTRPVVVMGHGFAAVRAHRLYAYAEVFASHGYTTVVFDYRFFGDSAGLPRQVLHIPSQLDDWRNALAFARALPGVDPDRVVAWGTSFSGGHVITLAGTGERLAAIIAQVPHVNGRAAVGAKGVFSGLRLMPAVVDDTLRGALGREPRYIDSVGEPGDLAAIINPDAVADYARLCEQSGLDGSEYPRTVAARILPHVGLYSPSRKAATVSCPALIQIARRDTVTPAAATRKAASLMKNATVREYDLRHADLYVEPAFTTIVEDQIGFLKSSV